MVMHQPTTKLHYKPLCNTITIKAFYQRQEQISRPTVSDVRGIAQVPVPHLRNPKIQDGHRSWIMQNLFLRPIEDHHLHWIIMTRSCKHDTIPQCIWKPCRNRCYRRPMCTWGILVIFDGHIGFGIKMNPLPPTKNKKIPIILTPEKDSSPKN